MMARNGSMSEAVSRQLKPILASSVRAPKSTVMTSNPTKKPATWLMIAIPVMWYKSRFINDSSTIDIQLHSTYFIVAGHHIILLFLIYLALCAVVYWKHQGGSLTPWMTIFHLVVSILFCTYLLDVGMSDGGLPGRYYSGGPLSPIQWYATAAGMILLFLGTFLLAQVIFLINIWRARRIQG